MMKFDRRSVLKGLGAAVPATAILPSLLSRKARAATTIPPRLLVFYTQEGWLQASPQATGTETNFQLGELTQPLTGLEKYLLITKGLDMKSDDVDPTTAANAHYAGATQAITAINRKIPTLPSGPSFDFAIANALNSPSPITPYPYLTLAVLDGDGGSLSGEWAVSFNANGAPLSFEADTATAYNRIFSSVKTTTPTTPTMPDNSVQMQQQMVTDLDNLDFTALAPKLGADDKQKLLAHSQLLSDLQKRLYSTTGSGGGTVTPAVCTKPGAPGKLDWSSSSAWGQRVAAHAQLAAAAFTCDLTRVVTIGIGDGEGLPPDLIAGYKSGDLSSTGFHDLVHQTAENGSQKDNPAAVAPVKAYHKTHATWFASVLNALKAVPESDGQTLLDHTIVLWCGQLASGSHDLHNLNWILAGGGGFKMGRYLQFPGSGSKTATPHNNLFVSIANAMGVNMTTFGNPSTSTGPIANLMG